MFHQTHSPLQTLSELSLNIPPKWGQVLCNNPSIGCKGHLIVGLRFLQVLLLMQRISILGNHMVFLIHFGINLHE